MPCVAEDVFQIAHLVTTARGLREPPLRDPAVLKELADALPK